MRLLLLSLCLLTLLGSTLSSSSHGRRDKEEDSNDRNVRLRRGGNKETWRRQKLLCVCLSVGGATTASVSLIALHTKKRRREPCKTLNCDAIFRRKFVLSPAQTASGAKFAEM